MYRLLLKKFGHVEILFGGILDFVRMFEYLQRLVLQCFLSPRISRGGPN